MKIERVNVLDRGYVELICTMPSDKPELDTYVANVARVSYDGVSKGYERDIKLLKYLIDNGHLSPFEHVILTFKIHAPIFVARQWMRHRTGSYNEISYRYVEVKDDEYYIPDKWRLQDTKNKQGSAGELDYDKTKSITQKYIGHVEASLSIYRDMLNIGVAREMARMILPVAVYTTFIFTIDLRNLVFGFLRQRCDPHAQYEIRQYAVAMLGVINKIVPKTVEFSGLDVYLEKQELNKHEN